MVHQQPSPATHLALQEVVWLQGRNITSSVLFPLIPLNIHFIRDIDCVISFHTKQTALDKHSRLAI